MLLGWMLVLPGLFDFLPWLAAFVLLSFGAGGCPAASYFICFAK